MKTFYKILGFFLILFFHNSYSQNISNEIVFHSNGSKFSPLITIRGNAEILWTFDDNTTSSEIHPVKDYGSEGLRINRLKVTPWSAVIGINLGYDASDGGSKSIPFISDQKVSEVENINLVARYLEVWCSSFNPLTSLNFDNFINLNTIECYHCTGLQNVSLKNTPKLKRLCLEENDIKELDVSESIILEDLRAALNDYNDIIFSNSTEEMVHICVRDNSQIINSSLFNNMEKFPNLSELLIWNCSQSGNLRIPATTADTIQIAARSNNYATIDFSGAFQRENGWAYVDLYGNQINSVNLEGCVQIKYLNLQNNKLSSASVDKVLQQLDELGTSNGHVDLRSNTFPTSTGYAYARNLESRGWIVYTSNQSVIQVFGNNNEISDGDTIPSRLNLTDFDSLNIDNGSTIHSFVIKNGGSSDLRLIGANFLYDAPYVSVIGVNPSDFTIISEPDPVITPGESTVFQIQFDPAEEGLRTAVISIPNSNWSRAPFDFRIQGTGVVVSSAGEDLREPVSFGLSQNYPNPFNPSTVISYQLPEAGFVTLKIYDILGTEITTLLNEEKAAGSYEVQFIGQQLASGIYYYKLQASDFVEVRKMILMK